MQPETLRWLVSQMEDIKDRNEDGCVLFFLTHSSINVLSWILFFFWGRLKSFSAVDFYVISSNIMYMVPKQNM